MITLTNCGLTYDATTNALGLGDIDIDMTGVTQVIFRVRVNKIGTGTQDWQLWNDTDGTQVAVISDAGVAGAKRLGPVTANVSLTGVKSFRVRIKSTVSTDDPIYYGSSILVVRP